MNMFKNHDHEVYKNLHTCYVRPVSESATQIWSPIIIQKGNSDSVDFVQRYFTRGVVGSETLSYQGIFDRLRLECLESRRIKLDTYPEAQPSIHTLYSPTNGFRTTGQLSTKVYDRMTHHPEFTARDITAYPKHAKVSFLSSICSSINGFRVASYKSIIQQIARMTPAGPW